MGHLFPDVRNRLIGVPIMVVGCSPSLDDTHPDIYEMLGHPDMLTVGINKAVLYFDPTWWIVTDSKVVCGSPAAGLPPFVPLERTKSYPGIKVFCHSWVQGSLVDGIKYLPWAYDEQREVFGTRGLGYIRSFATTDSYALQIFGGVMGCRPLYLVGVDYSHAPDGRTHAKGERRSELGIRHELPDAKRMNEGCRVAAEWSEKTGVPIYTCSPWPDTIVRDHFEYKPFEQAFEEITTAVRAYRAGEKGGA